MRLINRFQERPAPGEDVFISFTDKEGKVQTVPAILNPLGRDVYGASLDPDADDVYDAAIGFHAECQTVLGQVSGVFSHMKIWRNGKQGEGNEIFQDCNLTDSIAITSDTTVHVDIEIPWWDHSVVFKGTFTR